jgi:hypothetical protein
MISQVY